MKLKNAFTGRPALAAAVALILVLTGGAAAGVTGRPHRPRRLPPRPSSNTRCRPAAP